MMINLTREEAKAVMAALRARLTGGLAKNDGAPADCTSALQKIRRVAGMDALRRAEPPSEKAPRAPNFTIRKHAHPAWARDFTAARIDSSQLLHVPVGEYPNDGKTACGLIHDGLREVLPEFDYRVCGECARLAKLPRK